MRARTVAAVALAGAAVAAWLLVRSPPPDDPTPLERGEDAAPPGLASVPPAAKPTPAPVVATPTLVGTVRRGIDPVAAARVDVRPAPRNGFVRPDVDPGDAFLVRLGAEPLAVAAPVAFVATEAGGRFSVALPPGEYVLAARTPDGAEGRAFAVVPEQGRAEVDVVVERGDHVFRGRAVHADGRPFRGRVLLARREGAWWASGAGVPLREAAVSADGRFAFEGLAPGGFRLTVTDAARAASRDVEVPSPDEVVLLVDDGLRTLAGRVLAEADGKPVGGTTVAGSTGRVESWGGGVLVRATTDSEGRFEVPWPTASEWWHDLTVRAEGYLPARAAVLDGEPEIEVRLARAPRVRGRVTTESGAPVEGLDVHGVAIPHWNGDVSRGRTDAGGRFELSGASVGDLFVFAIGKGWTTRGLESVRGDGFNPLVVSVPASGTDAVRLTVVRGARAIGRVSDAAGRPVPDASVSARWGVPVPNLNLTRDLLSARTDASGAYSLDGLVPDLAVTLEAQARDRPSASSPPLTPSSGGEHRVDLVLGAGGSVVVTVLDAATSASVPGARVRLGAPGALTVAAFTASDGRARLGPVVADATLEVDHPRYVAFALESLPEGTVEVRLTPALPISGTVRWSDGTPAARVYVHATAVGRDADQITAVTRADGSFRLDSLERGPYELTAASFVGPDLDHPPVRAEAGAAGVEITLAGAPLPTVAVRVVGPDGVAVPSVRVAYRSTQGSGGTNSDVRLGRLVLDGVAGDVTVVASGARSASGAPLPLGATVVGPVPAVGEIVIRLLPEREIRGLVLERSGRPLPGVLVEALPASLPPELEFVDRAPHGAGRSAADGSFRVGGLRDTEYRLRVAAPDFVAPAEPVVARAGANDVRVYLAPSASARVRIVDTAGKAVAGARVMALRSEQSREATTGEDGWATLAGLDAKERYTLQVNPPRGLDVKWTSLPEWEPKETVVTLPPAPR